MDEAVDIRVKLQGARAASAEFQGLSRSVTDAGGRVRDAHGRFVKLGEGADKATGSTRGLSSSMSWLQKGIRKTTGAADDFGSAIISWRGAAVLGTVGYAASSLARVGLGFDARMESNTVAFTQFLGSASAARTELDHLYKVAAKTPFETEQIDTAARRMLAFGFNLQQTNGWLTTIGDTISGMGGGAQEIDQLVTAIGQIKSKGRLQGDELMQLSELGVVNRQKLSKDLGITPLELMSGNANVSGTRALKALKKQFDDTFGGQSAKQARTFNGQLSTLRDNLSQTLGKGLHPVFTRLEREVFPAAGKATDDFNKALGRKDLSMADRINLGWSRARHDLDPMARGIERDLKAAHLDDRFADLIDWAAPKMGQAAGHAGVIALKAFGNTWLHGDFLTKAVLTWFAGSRLGIWRRAGDRAFDAFSSRWGGGPGGPGPGGRGGKGGKGGKYAPWLLNPYTAAGAAFLYGTGLVDPDTAGLDPATERARVRARSRHSGGDPAVAFFRSHPGSLTPEIIATLTRHQRIELHVDGKRVAGTVVKHADDAAARKRG